MGRSTALEEFTRLIALPEDGLDLATAALVIAKQEYPDLDVEVYKDKLDRLAARARPALEAAGDNPFAIIDRLNTFLFTEQGFRGNVESYFDPRNSYLNDVLDRRCGIPITLSLVYMEIGRRLSFPLEGVGFPGHFMVRHAERGRGILIDPFHGGEILVPEDCERRLHAVFGEDTPLEPRYLRRSTPLEILKRMLTNLRQIHIRNENLPQALGVLDRLILLCPEDPLLLRDRGILLLKTGDYGRAVKDLETYLNRSPVADDTPAVQRQIKAIRRLTAMMN